MRPSNQIAYSIPKLSNSTGRPSLASAEQELFPVVGPLMLPALMMMLQLAGFPEAVPCENMKLAIPPLGM